ncbi:MAG: 16S rRNA (cytosine(1402)-N(4))-methyltransferase RsmH [Desulfofustis sp.]|nr:16S rRNA (cytosine(1402)-N(4))-methyltransferase RsmH [Desulfofustis sp.]
MEGGAHGTTHRPVLLAETIGMLDVVPGGIYVDGTLGLGGHTREILRRSAPDGRVVAFEWDEQAIAQAEVNVAPFRQRLTIVHRNFQELEAGLAETGHDKVNGIMVDIGLSSLQLDSGNRGFSFRFDEPLDMRMDCRRSLTAATLLASATEQELADIFYYFGEEKQARRIAGFIVEKRRQQPLVTTGQLAEVVAQAVPRAFHPPKIHVATKVFQAVRIAVNDELTNLGRFLDQAVHHLLPGARLCVISFHSLEDRIVKRVFAGKDELAVVTKKPITPGKEELQANPRSRSARLRVAERLA